jgi:hypothetical protein
MLNNGSYCDLSLQRVSFSLPFETQINDRVPLPLINQVARLTVNEGVVLRLPRSLHIKSSSRGCWLTTFKRTSVSFSPSNC